MQGRPVRRYAARAVFASVTLAIAVGVSACGGSDKDGGTASAAPDKKVVKVALLMEARPAQQPWDASLHDAGERLKKEDGAVEITESFQAFDATESEPIARQLVTKGTGVFFFHSYALTELAKKIAAEQPKRLISAASFGERKGPNLSVHTASYLQVGYANCWLLAKLSESKKIGFTAGVPAPYATEAAQGCKIGAKAADPDVKVLTAYSGDFLDQQKGAEQVKNLIGQGVDGLFPAAATAETVGELQVCEQKQLRCVGWASDYRRYAPNSVISSIIIDWSVHLRTMVDKYRAGEPYAEVFSASFANKGLYSTPFKGDQVPEDVQAEYREMIEGLTSGKIELPESKAHPGYV